MHDNLYMYVEGLTNLEVPDKLWSFEMDYRLLDSYPAIVNAIYIMCGVLVELSIQV